MNLRNVILVVISAMALLAAFAFGLGWFSSEPVLTVYLRCGGEVSGTLSVASVLKNSEQGSEESFDLETICKVGTIEIHRYLSQESLKFVYKRADGETIEVVSQYGRDIQRDQNGFYTVLKIMNTPPFIANDRV